MAAAVDSMAAGPPHAGMKAFSRRQFMQGTAGSALALPAVRGAAALPAEEAPRSAAGPDGDALVCTSDRQGIIAVTAMWEGILYSVVAPIPH